MEERRGIAEERSDWLQEDSEQKRERGRLEKTEVEGALGRKKRK